MTLIHILIQNTIQKNNKIANNKGTYNIKGPLMQNVSKNCTQMTGDLFPQEN